MHFGFCTLVVLPVKRSLQSTFNGLKRVKVRNVSFKPVLQRLSEPQWEQKEVFASEQVLYSLAGRNKRMVQSEDEI